MALSKLVLPVALALALPSGAFAARGIITKKPGGGSPQGRIIVVDDKSPAPRVQPGDALAYTEETKGGEGDLVEFSVAKDPRTGGALAAGIRVVTAATVVTGVSVKPTVEAGQVLSFREAAIRGSVQVPQGAYVLMAGGKALGNFLNAGGVVIILDGFIAGGIDSMGGVLIVEGGSVNGKVTSTSNAYTSVQNCVIKGKLEVLSPNACKTSGNTVSGQTNTPGCKS